MCNGCPRIRLRLYKGGVRLAAVAMKCSHSKNAELYLYCTCSIGFSSIVNTLISSQIFQEHKQSLLEIDSWLCGEERLRTRSRC